MMHAARLLTTIASTGFIAFASGYIVQNGEDTAAHIGQSMQNPGMARASAAFGPLALPRAPIPLTSGQDFSAFNQETGRSCSATFRATPVADAMIRVSLNAPCSRNEPVTLRHHGLTFTEVTTEMGRMVVEVPALTPEARVEAVMQNGQRFSSTISVPDVTDFYRAGLIWRGETGLQIHAQEFGAEFGGAGHIWAGSPGQIQIGVAQQGGYLLALGDRSLPNGTRAEVYSFPASDGITGVVAMSVQADIQNTNCGAMIAAQALQPGIDGSVYGSDLTLHLPDCERIGEHIVLDDVFQDLTIASR